MQHLKRLLITGAAMLFGLLFAVPAISAHNSRTIQLAFQNSAGKAAFGEVSVNDLPPEARQTLKLIRKGGPFPYPRDGITFSNRERLLPRQERGYYHEYTVPTPDTRNRGARRIVVGRLLEYYYTDDHYRSFRQIKGLQ